MNTIDSYLFANILQNLNATHPQQLSSSITLAGINFADVTYINLKTESVDGFAYNISIVGL